MHRVGRVATAAAGAAASSEAKRCYSSIHALANVTERKYTRGEPGERVSSLPKLGRSTDYACSPGQIAGRYRGQRDLLLCSNCTGLFYLPFSSIFLSLYLAGRRVSRRSDLSPSRQSTGRERICCERHVITTASLCLAHASVAKP